MKHFSVYKFIGFMLLQSCLILNAQTRLAAIFSDHMVLQRDAPIPVWGFGKANTSFQIQFHHQIKNVTVDDSGKWLVAFEAESAGGPYDLVIPEENIHLSDILMGDVWLCSGQSNMEMTVEASANAPQVISQSNNPLIRHVKIEREIAQDPLSNLKQDHVKWEKASVATVGHFLAVGYFFAQAIYQSQQIPIGLINASWGGTNIETWISRKAFLANDEFKETIQSMPSIDMDSLYDTQLKHKKKAIESLSGATIPDFNRKAFLSDEFDDTSLTLLQSKAWETQGLEGFDGVVWLRKSIVLSPDDIAQQNTLALGAIDDDDQTFVNGIQIGETYGWDKPRSYQIPPNILKVGKNILAVRITDNGGGGGLYGDTANIKWIAGKREIALGHAWKFQIEELKAEDRRVFMFPSVAYNAMIHPLVPLAFKGMLWYQGESNVPRAFQYQKAFPLLINSWRKEWNIGDFPVYFVQLATYKNPGNSNEGCPWAELREAQTKTLKLPNTGMCVITDVGDVDDIHPKDKQAVGKRLANIALHELYHQSNVYTNPSLKRWKARSNKALLSFNDAASGLIVRGGDKIVGFEIAGKDRIFYEATGKVQSEQIILWADEVSKPYAVRFGWLADGSANNVFNQAGLPLVPFRTDNWNTITKGVRYEPLR